MQIADTPLARNLARWIKIRGMTREELARRADIDPSTLYRVMVEGRNLQLRKLERVARALGVRPGQLLEDEPEQTASASGEPRTAPIESSEEDDRAALCGELLARAYRLPITKLRILVVAAEKLDSPGP